MADRITEGYKLYKDNAVFVEHYEPNHMIFKVKNKIAPLPVLIAFL